jgi:regulator-associated protein of mTOR
MCYVTRTHPWRSVWDWSKKRLLTTFSNGSTPGFAVSSLQVVNQWQGGMILAGSADGSAKLYRNYDPEGEAGPVQLVSAFRVLGEKTAMRRGAGLVLDWRQPGGTLLAGGDARVIKLWDAHTETALMDMDTHAEAPCGALASEGAGAGALFLAGFGDGGVRVLDRRMEEDDAVVRAYNAHTSWVQNVRWHPWHHGQFFTARSVAPGAQVDVALTETCAAWTARSSCGTSGRARVRSRRGTSARTASPRWTCTRAPACSPRESARALSPGRS